MQGIYLIRNKVNGKVYVGQSINVFERFEGHLKDLRRNKHHSPHLQQAFMKYGEKVFEHSVLEEVLDETRLESREQYWIDFYDSMNREKGYNMRGAGLHGKLSEETKKKISESVKKLEISDEARKKISQAVSGNKNGMYGKNHSEETKIKISNSKKGQVISKEARIRASETKKLRGSLIGEKNGMFGKPSPMRGKKLTIEQREKLSISKAKITKEQVLIIINLLKQGKKVSEISKQLNLSRSIVYKIKNGATWVHITRGPVI